MKINPNDYRKTLDALKPKLLEATPKTLHSCIVELAVGSHVPIQAVLAYALRNDVLGPLQALQDLDAKNRAFYRYDCVAPWKDL